MCCSAAAPARKWQGPNHDGRTPVEGRSDRPPGAAAALALPAASGPAGADPPAPDSPCTISGTAGPDVLNGTAGSDVICGRGGDDTIKGRGGDDLILAGTGSDTADGGDGEDDVRGGSGGDALKGGLGDDHLYGQAGDDTITDRDGAGYVDHVRCGDGTDLAKVDFFDIVNADCETRQNADREDPVAVDDVAEVVEDDPETNINVLFNDTDADGGRIKVASVTQPANGTARIRDAGTTVTYEPDPGYCNGGSTTDDFTYTLAPGGDTATVAVTVICLPESSLSPTATPPRSAPARR